MSLNPLLRRVSNRMVLLSEIKMANFRCASSAPKKGNAKYLSKNDVPSHRVGVIKSWDSKHTGGLEGSLWAHDRFIDDVMVRKFIEGTFYEMLVSDVVIKRRLNQVIISIFVNAKGTTVQKIYFLVGFSEKLLEHLLGCLVKMEVMSTPD